MKASIPFVERMLRALNCDIYKLAFELGTTVKQLEKLEGLNRGEIIELNRDVMWTYLSDYVDERLGELISVREELSRKLASDRKRQILYRARVRNR